VTSQNRDSREGAPPGKGLRFRDHLTVAVRPPDGLAVSDGLRTIRVSNRLAVDLAPHLDGRLGRGELLDALDPRLNPLEVLHFVERLGARGLVIEGPETAPNSARAERVVRRLEIRGAGRSPGLVDIRHLGSMDPACVEGCLDHRGWVVTPSGDLVLAVTDGYPDRGLGAALETIEAEGRSWLLAARHGPILLVGPAGGATGGACWPCASARLEATRASASTQSDRGWRTLRHGRPEASAFDPEAAEVLAAAVAVDIGSGLLAVDLERGTCAHHEIVPRPGCGACRAGCRGEPRVEARGAEGSDLRRWSRHRTWEAVARHSGSLTGLAGSLEPHRGSPGAGVHLWVATVREIRSTLRSRCAGAGSTSFDARLASVCEVVERASGLWYGCEPTISASYGDLGEDAIHPAACLLFSAEQYRRRDHWNRDQTAGDWVPEPFDEQLPIRWTALETVSSGRRRWLPTAMSYYGAPVGAERDFCRPESNGCAAGSDLDEATLHGVLELVERDAAALWWYSRSVRPGIDLGECRTPSVDAVRALCDRLGRRCWALDLTTDIGIPVAVVLSADEGPGHRRLAIGFGAHLDPVQAVARACFEMVQLQAVFVTLGRTPRFFSRPPVGAYLDADPGRRLRRAEDFPAAPVDDVDSALCHGLERLSRAGLEAARLEQSRPGFGLAVARVVVPGLRPFWPRFAPGRLFDIPRRLGWKQRLRSEHDLNPSHLWL
jgi:bacteriocin biosynthesis cyclodehydratase domain-containing protein